MSIKIISGFEPTRIITREKQLDELIDILETSKHYENYEEDLENVKKMGIDMLRVAIPWHRIEKEKSKYDWKWTDKYIEKLAELDITPILDPLHHVSIPSWLKGGFLDKQFAESYINFFIKIVKRYPWINKYTIVNEPLVTTYFCTHEGVWYPFATGKDNFEEGLNNIYEIICVCGDFLKIKNKEHWYVDACENHEGTCESSVNHANYLNEHRFKLLDRLVNAGVKIDVLGLDYYSHCEFKWGTDGRIETDNPIGFAAIAEIYRKRYNLPLALTETNIRGYAEDRLTWFKHMYQQCEKAGITIMCWYPFTNCTDWDSLVTQVNRNIDPQGIYDLHPETFERVENIFVETVKKLNQGEISIHEVEEYPYQPPLDTQLKGFINKFYK